MGNSWMDGYPIDCLTTGASVVLTIKSVFTKLTNKAKVPIRVLPPHCGIFLISCQLMNIVKLTEGHNQSASSSLWDIFNKLTNNDYC